MNKLDSAAGLRSMSAAELERLGQQSLSEHLVAQASLAASKYAPLNRERVEAFLQDPECVRYPVRLAFEFGDMAMHQFAQPDIDWRNRDKNGRLLYLRPTLHDRPDLVPLAVAYMVPVINYGEIITDEHCLLYGAALLGLTPQNYYAQICSLADLCGAETKARTDGPTKPCP